MKNQFLYLILILVLLLIIKSIISKENFDAKLYTDKLDCGDICTRTMNCLGFAHDASLNACYLATNPILYKPIGSPYGEEYNKEMFRCNKPNPIKNEFDIKQPNALSYNALYQCSEEEESDPQKIKGYQIINKQMNILDPERDKPIIKDYKIIEIDWPSQKKDYSKKYFEDLLRTKYITYDRDDNQEYIGQFMFKDKCIRNTPIKKCAMRCNISDDCNGFEYSEGINNGKEGLDESTDYGICCLKKNIKKIIPRKRENKNSSYYVKKLVNKLDLENTYIKL